jgi:hypothetical protein
MSIAEISKLQIRLNHALTLDTLLDTTCLASFVYGFQNLTKLLEPETSSSNCKALVLLQR